MNPRALVQTLAACVLAAAGCGANSGSTFPADGTIPADGAAASLADLAASFDLGGAQPMDDLSVAGPPADLATLAAYPPGPYGTVVGSVIPNLAWVGYADEAGDAVATTKPYAAYAMLDLHRGGRPYGFVHIAEVF